MSPARVLGGRLGVVVGLAAVAAFGVAEPAFAGAPNWECKARNVTLALDQHDEVAIIRFEGSILRGTVSTSHQNGYDTDMTVTANRRKWRVVVRGEGRASGATLELHTAGREVQGFCVPVPGNQSPALAPASGQVFSFRPGASAPVRQMLIPPGQFYWRAVRYGGFESSGGAVVREATYVRTGGSQAGTVRDGSTTT